MKVVIGGIYLESNTFAPAIAGYGDFRMSDDLGYLGREVLSWAEQAGLTLIPAKFFRSVPAGAMKVAVFESYLGQLLRTLSEGVDQEGADAILLKLHGSTVLEDGRCGESLIIEAVRERFGTDFLVTATFDLHGNIEKSAVEQLNYATSLRTAPHTDQVQTTIRALEATHHIFATGQKGIVRACKLPIVVPGEAMMTTTPAVGELYARLEEHALSQSGLCGSIFNGFAWADVESCGVGVVVSGFASAKVESYLLELTALVWNARYEFVLGGDLIDLSTALKIVKQSKESLFLSDTGDNITAGSSGTATSLFEAALDEGLTGGLFLQVWSPAIVGLCWGREEGSNIPSAELGFCGQSGKLLSVAELPVSRVARIEIKGNEVVFTEKRLPLVLKGQFEQLGIDILKYRYAVFKLGYLFPYPASLGVNSILVDTDGPATLDLSRLRFQRRKRPFYPIDPDCSFNA